jgi:hypothetical protein
MNIEVVDGDFSVCKVEEIKDIRFDDSVCFFGKTDQELSLVCQGGSEPQSATEVEYGWRAIRVKGQIDFSAVGVLAKITGILAQNGISVFAVSTYNTDYVFVKAESLPAAIEALSKGGFYTT